MWEDSIIIGYSNPNSSTLVEARIKQVSENYNILFANFHNSIIGIGGVGTATRSTQKLIPKLHMVCYDPLLRRNTPYGQSMVYPVILDNKTLTNFQIKYAKQYLWPLLHDLPPHLSKKQIITARDSYIIASQAFSEKICQITVKNNKPWIYWINDYSLVGTVGFVRAIKPDAKICFSLRSPFGHHDYPKFLTEDAELLIKSLIQADFISFHRMKDIINFLRLTENIAKKSKDIQVIWENHTVCYKNHIAIPRVVPLGNDPGYRQDLAETKKAKQVKNKFIALAKGRKIITSISRFEIHKGIIEELDTIEQLIKLFPKMKDKFIFVRVAYLAKEYLAIPEYSRLYFLVKKRVEQINNTYGNRSWKPIIALLDKKFTDHEVTGLLGSTDILLVMSLADGFNHSSVEGVLSKLRTDSPLLLLSSDVGSSDYLGEAPIKMNPKDKFDSAIKIYLALANTKNDTKKRQVELKKLAKRLSTTNWTLNILEAVINIENVPSWIDK